VARILVIDDNYDMLTLLETMLQRQARHEVITSQDGEEGLEKAFENKPNIAIVDVMMPGLSGYDVIKQLRDDPRTREMGIITLTARGQPVDKAAAMEAGSDVFLSKPVKVPELIEQIENLLKQQKKPSQALVLPVFSLRGGVGVTTIVVNIATLLQQAGRSTVILDLSPNSGHCAVFLGLRPRHHWGEFLEKTEFSIAQLLLSHASGLKLLAAPPVPMQSGWFNPEELASLLKSLKENARFVVVDMPPLVNDATFDLLQAAPRTLLITGDDPPSLQSTFTTVQALKDYRDHLILVHNANTPGPHPSTEALQNTLRTKLAASLPYEAAQSTALRKGIPLAISTPQSPFISGLKHAIQQALRTES
jgi:pilus assembly protein CpaE